MLPSNREGDKVNLEVDVLGKYVERSFSVFLDRLGALEQWQEVCLCVCLCARTCAMLLPERVVQPIEKLGRDPGRSYIGLLFKCRPLLVYFAHQSIIRPIYIRHVLGSIFLSTQWVPETVIYKRNSWVGEAST